MGAGSSRTTFLKLREWLGLLALVLQVPSEASLGEDAQMGLGLRVALAVGGAG